MAYHKYKHTQSTTYNLKPVRGPYSARLFYICNKIMIIVFFFSKFSHSFELGWWGIRLWPSPMCTLQLYILYAHGEIQNEHRLFCISSASGGHGATNDQCIPIQWIKKYAMYRNNNNDNKICKRSNRFGTCRVNISKINGKHKTIRKQFKDINKE